MFESKFILPLRQLNLRSIYLLLLFLLLAGTLMAAPKFLEPLLSYDTADPVTAIAFTADEALVVLALEEGEDSLLELREVNSGKVIQRFRSPDNPATELVFDFRQRLLALSGLKRIELWDLESVETETDPSMISQSRIWQKEVKSPAKMKFSQKTAKLRWTEGMELKEIPIRPPFIEAEVWTGLEGSKELENFQFDAAEKILALTEKGNTQIRLLQPWQNQVLPKLDYHHFPVVDMFFLEKDQLISLDREQNLAWGNIKTRIKSSPRRKDVDSLEGQAQKLFQIYKDQVLLYTTSNPDRARILERNGKVYHTLSLSSSGAVKVSPTGRYVMTADEDNRVQLFQSVLHQSSEDYLKKLNHYGAEETARRFQNQLPENSVSSKDISWKDENKTLKILEESLKVAETTQQWLEAESLAKEILILDPKNSQAKATLKRLKDNQDGLILEKGIKLLEEKQYAEAISLFKKISQDSPMHPDARNLIASADRDVQTALSLKNAEEQIRIGNWEGASIILQQILENDPANIRAKQLLEDAESTYFWSRIENTFYLVLIILLASAGLWWLYQKRQQLGSVFFNNNEEPVSLKTFPNVNLKGETPDTPSPDENRFAETLSKTSEFLNLAKKRDFSGEHATRLMDFEAEIKIISGKAHEPDADFKRLNTQLMVLMQTLRGLKFKGRPQQQKQKSGNKKKESKADQQKENYYQLLGVKPSASESEIRKAYHQKIKEYHPDKHQNTEFEWVREQAASMSQDLTKAYETLSDRSSRERYDATLS